MSEITSRPRKPRPLPPLMELPDAAADRLRQIYATDEAERKLRIGVSTKGCSGHSYDMSWVDQAGPTEVDCVA